MFAYLNSIASHRNRRARLLAGCAVAAALTTPAFAQQAFQATPDVAVGSIEITQGQSITGGLRDTVNVYSRQSVINWTPNDTATGGGAINILPGGNELVFTANADTVGGSYTVLNRIIPNDPSRPVQFDGHVMSQFDSGYGATTGGNIWFYSPGGIIAGATSRFDVGSLVLSANDIDFSNGLFGDDSGSSVAGTIRFRGAADSRSGVTIMPGAQINAAGNYVALVAPRISQGGSINVEGGAALVAAESADITIPVSGGLFDIVVQTGSNVDAGGETTLTHSGTTEVRDAAQTGAQRRVYLMAVPKNDAVTMLVSGSLGYAPAAQAQLGANGAIYLTTGSTVASDSPAPGTEGAIRVTGGDFGGRTIASARTVAIDTLTADLSFASDLQAFASGGAITMTASGSRNITAVGDVLLRQDSSESNGASPISVSADAGGRIQALSLSLDGHSNGAGDAGYGGGSAVGHTLSLTASNGGIITASNFIELDSSALGGNSFSRQAGNGTGGTVTVSAVGGGQIVTNGSLNIDVYGQGGEAGYGGVAVAGGGFGGIATLNATSGGLISTGQMTVDADGSGGYADFGASGGSGMGGAVTLNVQNGEVDAGYIRFGASGFGSDGVSAAGAGTGGTISIANKASSSLFAGNGIDLYANGNAGSSFSDGATLGDGTGGTITIANDASSFSAGEGTLNVNANGIGGFSNVFNPTTGRGGTISVTINSADPNNVESSFSAGGIRLTADGSTTRETDFRFSVPHGNSGIGVGGSVMLNLTGGPASTGDISLSATGTGGNGDYDNQAGAGFAGRAELALNGGALTAGTIDVVAQAFGGDGAFGESGYGGAGTGGTAGIGTNPFGAGSGAYLTGTAGSLSATTVRVSAEATGGFGGDGQAFGSVPVDAASGGAASGGTARIATSGVSFSLGTLSVIADATGGGGGAVDYSSSFSDGQSANAGHGGTGTGGIAEIGIGGGEHSFGTVAARANGEGGSAGYALGAGEGGFDSAALSRGGNGGDGIGGTASVLFTSATIVDQPDLTAEATGSGQSGGSGAQGGNGGAGMGGTALIRLDGGTSELNSIRAYAYADGGTGGYAERLDGGNGGNAQGGAARFETRNGAVVNIADNEQFDPFDLDASAFAGDGASGGSFAVSGFGGRGGNGGTATGGTASALLQSGAQATILGVGGVESRPPQMVVSARGGNGGSGGNGAAQGDSGGVGGDGGSAFAGLATFQVNGGRAIFGDVFTDASAQRGSAGSGGEGAADPATGIVTTAASGANGTGFGGRLTLTVADGLAGQAGSFKAGDFSADLTGGDVDGSLLIADTGINGQGDIHLGSLFAVSFSNAPNTSEVSSDYDIQSSARAIQVDGDVTLRANGQVRLAFQSTGGFTSGTQLDIFSSTRGISITNASPAATHATSLSAPSIVLRTRVGDIDAQPGSLLTSTDTITANAFGGNVRIADAQAAQRIDVNAFGNATVGSLTSNEVTVLAGFGEGFVPADATVTGTVTSRGGVTIQAGRDVTIATGAKIIADTFVTISSGDDIVIGPGALVRAANNPPPETGYGATDPLEQFSQLRLLAGSIDAGEVVEGNVASILINGTLEAPNRTLFMSAGAVQAGSTTELTAGNLYVRLNNIPVGDQVPSNDGGQLTGTVCLEGSVCLGTARVNGIVRIGETEFEPINLRLNGGIDGTDVLLRAQSVSLGQAGVANVIKASDRLTIEALNGSLALNGPLAITGGSNGARVAAFRNITGAAAQLNAPGTLDLFAGNDITLGGVGAGTIRTVDFDGNVLNAGGITVPGTIAIGRITSGSPLDLDAGRNIALDSFAVTGTATLTAANGTISVASDASASDGITATAKAVTLNGLNGLKVTNAAATAGDLVLATQTGTLAAGSSSASGNATLTGGAVTFAALDAGNALAITGNGDVTGGTANAGTIAIGTTGAFTASALTADAGDLSISAANGITLPRFSASGAATLTAANGAVKVDTDAKAAGGVTGIGRSVLLVGQDGLDVTLANATAGDLSLTAVAGDLTIDTANSTGMATLSAQNGAVLVSADAAAAGGIDAEGQSVALTGRNGLNVTRASATNGDVRLTTISGPLSIGGADATGAIALDSGGTISFATLKAGGTADLAAQGAVTGDTVSATALDISTPAAIRLTDGSDAGPITATGGSVDISGRKGLRVLKAVANAGDLSLVAQQGLTADQLSATGVATLRSGTGPLVVTNDIVAGNGLILSAPTIDITAQNGLNVLQADATAGDLKLTTASGTLSAGNATATGAITLASGGDVLADSLESGYGAISVSGAQGVALGTLTSGGGITLAASNGTVTVSNDIVAAGPIQATGQAIDLTAQGDLVLTKAVATGGDLSVRSVSGELTLGNASATGALTAATPGLVTINGAVTGGQIALTSNDIAIGSEAQLGSRRQTTALTLTSTADRMIIGDGPGGSGYRLDNGELARIASGGDISLVSTPLSFTGDAFSFVDPAAANVVLGSLTFDGGQFGPNGTLLISSPRAIGIVGNAQFKNIGSGQTVTLRSASDIALAAETGLVTLKDGNGGLSGTLRLEAQQVQALSTKARSEIAGLDLNAVRQRLGTNDQLENDGGYFQAGQIVVRIGRLAFIQNSGANSDDPNAKRGFTANSFRIETTSEQPVQLVLNGRVGSATGAGLINAVNISGSLVTGSSFNGCTAGTQCGALPTGPGPEIFAPVLSVSRDQIEDDRKNDEKEQSLEASQTRPEPLIQIIAVPTSRFDPLIDQPVTGAGNEDLWLTPVKTPTP